MNVSHAFSDVEATAGALAPALSEGTPGNIAVLADMHRRPDDDDEFDDVANADLGDLEAMWRMWRKLNIKLSKRHF